MRNENKETNQGKKAIGESMGSRIVLALIVVAVRRMMMRFIIR